MNRDALRLGLDAAPPQVLAREAAQLAGDLARGVLKLILMRAGQGRGYRPDAAATDRLVRRYEAPRYPAACWERGIQVARGTWRLAAQPALAGIKHLNRLEQVLASRDWPDGADEVLLDDESGRPACGTRSNLFFVHQGVLQTPALERCGVAGHMRAKVLALARALGLEARVQDGSWADLDAAQEIFVTNSLVGIWPVGRLGARSLAVPGPVTRRLAERLAHPRWADA